MNCDESQDMVDRARVELRAIYADLGREIAAAGPRCELSGRCCRFQEYGHRLYLTKAEADVLVADAPAAARELEDGVNCPWQDENGRCTAREARPLGCRMFFCDPAFSTHMERLGALFHDRLKRLAEHLDYPWMYAPLHVHLRAAEQSGRLRLPRRAGPDIT